MKTKISIIILVLALAGASQAQSINVTSTGVGIGTATPAQKRDVAGNVAASGNITATGDIYSSSKLTALGNVAIGSGASPAVAKLDVAAAGGAVPLLSLRATLTGVGQYQMIRFGDSSQISAYQKGAIIYESVSPVARGRFHIALENTDGAGSVALSDAKLTVLSNGNVGVGTVNPTFKFTVNGTMMCRGYYTDTGAWSDYVFAKDYKLPTLTEVEQHIAANGHLPGIPSEKEVMANGINLGDMQSKLLAQIEQLTLHMIKHEKAIAALKAENAELKSHLKTSILSNY